MGGEAGKVTVSFQAARGPWGLDKLNEALAQTDGELEVTEYHKRGVPTADFVRCFKRLNVSLFHSHVKARTLRVVDRISIGDAAL